LQVRCSQRSAPWVYSPGATAGEPLEPAADRSTTRRAGREWILDGRSHPGEGVRPVSWQVGLRWWVPPAILLALAGSRWAGFDTPAWPVLFAALAVLAYNAALAWACRRAGRRSDRTAKREPLLALLSVGLDYAALLLLIQLTGGTRSPLLLFLVFHVVLGAILLPPRIAYLFASLAAASVAVLGVGSMLGWWSPHILRLNGQAVLQPGPASQQVPLILAFSATVLIVAALATSVMAVLRRRAAALEEANRELADWNDRLRKLHAAVGSITRATRLGPALERIVKDMSIAVGARGVFVMLLTRDGQHLRLVAGWGLPFEDRERPRLSLDDSPAVRRVLAEMQPGFFSLDDLPPGDLRELLATAGIRAALLVPLSVEERLLGILGVHGDENDLAGSDPGFLGLAADLVAIAIENARSYEAVEKSSLERTKFMVQVAHNLRAPLNASLSMLDVVTNGYVGEVGPDQLQYLERIRARLERLSESIGELLSIAQTQAQGRELVPVTVDPHTLAADVERTFRDVAAGKNLRFVVSVADDLPELIGDADMLLQMIENLVSNAIKYTQSGGEVNVFLGRGETGDWHIAVVDTGIGIPEAEQPRLFTEFYRASNARRLEEVGTGLGLALVKRTAEWHGGTVHLESREGEGTRITVKLPREGARRLKAST
jgi:signal transduction histidine kinase